jgi:site-specific DNA-methyltransferase (adenine-specific)
VTTAVRESDLDLDLRLGRWEDVLADVECDALITDPPYGARTHEGQRHSRKDPRYSPDACLTATGLPYAHFTEADVAAFVAAWSPRVRFWFCAFTSHDLLDAYARALERAGRYVFAPLACVQRGMNVRLAGDGPSNWTTHLIVARPRGMLGWGTLPGAYVVGQDQDRKRGVYVVGGKPLGLMRALVRDYSRPGDLVCDPCAGGGTTLLAAAIEGRRAVGAEMDPAHFEIAQKRFGRGYTPTLFYRRPQQGADDMPRQPKNETSTLLLLPDELAVIADKHRKALTPLAAREAKLEAELREVRAKRIAIEECLLPVERIIADQRARADAVKKAAEGPALEAIHSPEYTHHAIAP